MDKIKIITSLLFSKILILFGYKYDPSCIPSGQYCYEPDYTKNQKKDTNDFYYYINPCKYYKRVTNQVNGCKYLGMITDDFLFYDMCKFCNKKK